MTTILRIQSGADLQNSSTRRIGQLLVDELRARHAGATVHERDLVRSPLPHIDAEFARTMFTELDSPALALSNALVDELLATDILVLESPMYNFSVSSAVKAWIDHVVRAQRTFRYDDKGVHGMLAGKRAVLVLGSGAIYSSGPFQHMDFQEPYLRAMLGFLGLVDVHTIRIEGSNMGPDISAKGLAEATAAARAASEAMA